MLSIHKNNNKFSQVVSLGLAMVLFLCSFFALSVIAPIQKAEATKTTTVVKKSTKSKKSSNKNKSIKKKKATQKKKPTKKKPTKKATAKATAKPKETASPKATSKPKVTPTPTKTPKPTSKPTPTPPPYDEPQIVVIDNKFSRAKGSAPFDMNEIAKTDKNKTNIWHSSDKKVASVNLKGIVTVKKKGMIKLSLDQDGEIKKIYTLYVTKPKLSKSIYFIAKNDLSSVVEVKGTNAYSTLAFFSDKEKNVQVDNFTGVITPKKNKYSKVYAYADGIWLFARVSIGSEKAVAALELARKAIGKKYSQGKRMKKKYYDCSSLTWRSYEAAGLNMGNTSWALTASLQAKWCDKNSRLISKKKIEVKKLKPGDLIFYSSGKNGRYRNISHVSIYTGMNTIIHASSSAGMVKESNVIYFQKIVGIGRPTGKVSSKVQEDSDGQEGTFDDVTINSSAIPIETPFAKSAGNT